MKIVTSLIAAAIAATGVAASPAAAQATRTWVSGVGDDVNPCSRTAPCQTFAGALSKTAAGGEINMIDPGSYGSVTITKSVTIRAHGIEAGVMTTTNGITVNGAGIKVVLDGLDIDGINTGAIGVDVVQAAEVTVVNSVIRNFTTAGINVGVSTGKATVAVDSVQIVNNNIGLVVQSPNGRSGVRVTNSLFTGNATASARVRIANNRLLLSGNYLLDPVKGLDISEGGTATTSGTNTITAPASDTATLVPES